MRTCGRFSATQMSDTDLSPPVRRQSMERRTSWAIALEMETARRTFSGSMRVDWGPDPGVLASMRGTSIPVDDNIAAAQLKHLYKRTLI
jgi:hypothetical protein